MPRAVIYLYQLQRFLTYDDKCVSFGGSLSLSFLSRFANCARARVPHRSLCTWNFRGEKVASFEECFLHSESQTPLHISDQQEYVFSLCKAPDDGAACISVSDLRTGRHLGRFFPPAHFPERNIVASISSLSYDTSKHELLCGTADGRVLLWAA